MSPCGHRAGLPGRRGKTAHGLLDGLAVRCFAEGGRASRGYRFDAPAVAPGLQQGPAEAVARRTAPGAGPGALDPVAHTHRTAMISSRCLATPARSAY
ncbi:hypothetical protein GCM10010446_28590 [Streptomyces enissocaesilis]|uniref:Uncharacterized protein n=1 Tax=Streptomyces enissocaesilis TaxID=332589 RepID=A0ABN3X7X9_9ACTN